MNARILCLVALAILGSDLAVYAMATEEIGPDRDHPTVSQPDWPKGIVTVPRHPSRVYSIWVNGNENFYFKADLAQVNELLMLFSKARLRDHQVWIKHGKPQVRSFQETEIAYNVNLRVVAGIALAMGEKAEGGGLEPQLTVYVDDAVPAEQLFLPNNLILRSEVQGVALKGGAAQPVRHPWFGRVQFEDDEAGAGSAPGLRTQISLWESRASEEIKLARVDHEGWFRAAFSEAELADLKSGKSWLTITVGNWLAEAQPSDPRFPVGKLGDKTTAQVVRLPAPKFYYGRILFEDGTAPNLGGKPWPGARITIDFSYAGSVEPDDQGYFKVFFTADQYEKVKSDKPRKNIYIPNPLEKQHSTARVAFPPSLLSQDRAQAGTVRIPRP